MMKKLTTLRCLTLSLRGFGRTSGDLEATGVSMPGTGLTGSECNNNFNFSIALYPTQVYR